MNADGEILGGDDTDATDPRGAVTDTTDATDERPPPTRDETDPSTERRPPRRGAYAVGDVAAAALSAAAASFSI